MGQPKVGICIVLLVPASDPEEGLADLGVIFRGVLRKVANTVWPDHMPLSSAQQMQRGLE